MTWHEGIWEIGIIYYWDELTSWSWAILEKSPIVQLLKNLPEFYGTRRFIIAFTRALHWSLSWARSIQYIPPHPVSQRSILTLSTHLRIGLPNGLFPCGFPTNTLYAVLFTPFMLHALPIASYLNRYWDYSFNEYVSAKPQYLTTATSRLALGSTQLSRRESMKLAAHPYPVLRLRMRGT
jgi:hypothetical protein